MPRSLLFLMLLEEAHELDKIANRRHAQQIRSKPYQWSRRRTCKSNIIRVSNRNKAETSVEPCPEVDVKIEPVIDGGLQEAPLVASISPEPIIRHNQPSTTNVPEHPFSAAGVSIPSRRRPRVNLRTSPPSQRRSQFTSITEKLSRLEERRLALDEQVAKNNLERDQQAAAARLQAALALSEGMKALGDGLKSVGEGLKALAGVN